MAKAYSDILISNMKVQFVAENMRFERGNLGDRTETLDRILNRKINIQLDAANVFIDDLGKVSRRVKGEKLESNDHFLNVIEKSGASWKQLSSHYGYGGIPFEFEGTKEQLLPIIAMWDAHSRDEGELEEALEDWDGSESELWEIIG